MTTTNPKRCGALWIDLFHTHTHKETTETGQDELVREHFNVVGWDETRPAILLRLEPVGIVLIVDDLRKVDQREHTNLLSIHFVGEWTCRDPR